MSAFIVSKGHIDALIAGGLTGHERRLDYWHNGAMHYLDHATADETGRMMWLENLESVKYRYPDDKDGEHPGPNGLTEADILAYIYYPTCTRVRPPLEVLKLLSSYDYQSCEHPGWADSEAKALVDALTQHTISRLPGYEEAPWTID